MAPVDVNAGIYQPPKDEAWVKAWQVTELLLLAIDQAVRQHGAKFMLITLSNPLQVDPDAPLRRKACENLGVEDLTYPDRRVAAFANRHGIRCLTLVDSLAKHATDTGVNPHLFTPHAPGVHYRATAHKFIADEVAQAILGIGSPGASRNPVRRFGEEFCQR